VTEEAWPGYRTFDRASWAGLRAATPMLLQADELEGMRSLNDRLSLDEVTDVSCEGDCGTLAGGMGVLGAVLGAVGVGVVAVLALRAMGEWSSGQKRTERF
jgi:hypothetical protein